MLSHTKKKSLVIGLVAALVLTAIMQQQPSWRANAVPEEPVDILLIMDHDYGANVPFIITIFERYGWNFTTTGLDETLVSCAYLGETLDVDILLTDIVDITQFDAISIMPGESHEQLRTTQAALDLIQEAMAQNLVVSAWCRAVRVLAAADVLDGKNITGHSDYESEYIAAGATFNELVPPVIDGSLVTGVRSRFYRDEMCQAIATALGVYESDPPSLDTITLAPSPTTIGMNACLQVSLSDAHPIYMVNAKVFELNESGLRANETYLLYFELTPTGLEGTYNGTLANLALGSYTVDIYAWDNYMNDVVYTYAVNFTVSETSSTPFGIDDLLIPAAVGGSVVVIVLVAVLLKRR
jgi:hypothetical protein